MLGALGTLQNTCFICPKPNLIPCLQLCRRRRRFRPLLVMLFVLGYGASSVGRGGFNYGGRFHFGEG